MKLSIVIVNYNVKHFLEQCLYSVISAKGSIETEIFVVDNNSVDGSCAMVKEKFPEVHLIINHKNHGFAYANNQAIRQSNGEYVLLLNPDTLVQENTFSSVVAFMDSHRDAGGLGVKMIDGKGNFLPESKRGLPTPEVAFYKIFGISRLFSKSKRFGKYHLSYLDKDKIHEVDVLSGAFMLLRKSAIEKTGLLDEDYFMYGEDIDLSYRINKAGYKNYYYPETTIIHYKGESTKKGSINYVMVFYKAMIIFAKKHFNKKNARLFSFFINLAIYFRASLAIAYRFSLRLASPIVDSVLIYIGFYLITPLWSIYKFGNISYYPSELFRYAVPAYISIWLITLIFTGGYDRPLKIINVLKGITIGTAAVLLLYSLLPEYLRFSRALILLGAAYSLIVIPVGRFLLHLTKSKAFKLDITESKKVVIAGGKSETKRVSTFLEQTDLNRQVAGFVNNSDADNNGYYLGNLHQMEDIVRIHRINEVIFCAKDIQPHEIIKYMLLLAELKIDYKIAGPDGLTVIGSNSVHTAGDLYTVNFNSISRPQNKRNKRIIDFSLAFILLLLSPVLFFFYHHKIVFIRNLFSVLLGLKSFVGYNTKVDITGLPQIKKSILNPLDPPKNESSLSTEKANILYAKDYRVTGDFRIIFKSLKKLDREIK